MPELLYLSRRDVEAVALPADHLVELLEQTFRMKAAGQVQLPPKPGVHPRPDALIHAMPAYLAPLDAVGLKWISAYSGNTRRGLPHVNGLVILNDADSGLPVAVMDATWITAMRTAAVSLLCARRLVPAGPLTLGIYGLGVQARSHLQVFGALLPFGRVLAYDLRPERVEAFLHDAPALAPGIPVEAAAGPEPLVRESRVLVTAGPIFKQPRPVVRGEWIPEGAVLLPIDFGSALDPSAFEAVDRLVVDDVPQFEYYRSLGYFQAAPRADFELADLVMGKAPGRIRPTERIMALNLGLAMEDVAVGAELYRRARAAGVGTRLPL